MNAVRIVLDVDKNPPLKAEDKDKTVCINSGVVFTRIPGGMQSGKSAVGITAPMPDGRNVFIELSMVMFEGVAAAFKGAEQRAKECDGRN